MNISPPPPPPMRTANYKPNIWNYDSLESLTDEYHEEKKCVEAGKLKEKVCGVLRASRDSLHSLELIDLINKLALSHYFEDEINESISRIKSTSSSMMNDLYSCALCLRILRQHGHHVPKDKIVQLFDEERMMIKGPYLDEKTQNEVFEASHHALDGECLVERLAVQNLNSDDVQENVHSMKCPSHHFTVTWFNAKRHITAEKESELHRLAGLSFNTIQVQHQKELIKILRWWRDLGLLEVLSFTRDRVVESFLWAVGVAYEPQYGSLRKWLTKAILLILILDDLYDIYGSEHELEQFTTAVERWDPIEIQQLPEAYKTCFWTLHNIAIDIDNQVQKEKGWSSILPELKQVWTGFCKALLVEAKWEKKSHSPSLMEYLNNGWITSSGPILSLHILLGLGKDMAGTMAAFRGNQQLIHHASLIIRLCNDQATSQAEVERGDAPSSIVCHMREANVTEREARHHIRNLTLDSWKKMNGLFLNCSHPQQRMMRYIVNTARVANFIYQNGDGFGVQDRETKDQVLSCLIQPLQLCPSPP